VSDMENMDVGKFGAEMLELLKQQRQLFLELQKQSLEQRALIKAQQNEELLSVLARRQKVVNAVGQIHRQTALYREKWPQMKDKLSEPVRREIGQLLSELERMLNTIIEQDQQDCQELSSSKQMVAQQMNQAAQARTASSYYGGTAVRYNNPSSGSNFQITG